ncbi:MAG: hypothetical protein PW844_10275 [Pantoea sp.]|uniref:hypothetical protein n=1 Tax=Pantoea sp. TaxID=69393 RepID=UPI00239EBFF6|nr:hypothetical protein [Pantoea sp.]MDE1186853.1 hypothetical protein [Pantoea sp.]
MSTTISAVCAGRKAKGSGRAGKTRAPAPGASASGGPTGMSEVRVALVFTEAFIGSS